ncbi:hypothetical protein [Xylanibacter ruminicola]|uniref:Uncharacterized protein n=1 Tax=Xylanibacter ruminicola TaxID=839 RepID=A0A1M6R624_XYLRU|nr:hypothetical protein [Xylanibacter ruminicola]SHK27798.1 hypothetical protein SAMN05216463_10196 [Xylanibacter ruminicola]
MKELSPEKKLRLEKLELLTYDVEVGNTHIVRKVKGTKLNSAFLLGELSDNRRTMIVRQVENDRRPVRVENKNYEDVLRNILIGYIQSKRCKLPFNEDFACERLSLKLWPKDYIDGFIPNDFRVQPTFLDELARMVSIHVTANFLSKPHKEAA